MQATKPAPGFLDPLTRHILDNIHDYANDKGIIDALAKHPYWFARGVASRYATGQTLDTLAEDSDYLISAFAQTRRKMLNTLQ